MNFINYIRNIDQAVFHALYNLTGHSMIGDFLVIFFGEYFVYLVLIIFVYFAYKSWRQGKISPYLAAVAAAIVARFGVITLFRYFYHRPRPFLALSLEQLITNDSYSFPSGHTIFLFSLATATYFFNKKLSYFIFISGFIVGVARIMGGVHYPSDILGGIILGIITGVIVYKIFSYFYNNENRINLK